MAEETKEQRIARIQKVQDILALQEEKTGGSSEDITDSLFPVQEMHPSFTAKDRLISKNFATNPEAQVKYLQSQHPDLEVKLLGEQVAARAPGEKQFKVLDPDTGIFTKDILNDVGDIAYDIPAGMASGAATALGALGGLPGMMGAGGASSAGLEALRQKIGMMAGIDQKYDPMQIATNGVFGAAAPLVPAAIKKAAVAAAPKIVQTISGVPAVATKELIENWDKLKNLPASGTSDLAQESYQALKDYLAQQKTKAGQALGDSLKATGKKIKLDEVKGVFDDMLKQLDDLSKDGYNLNIADKKKYIKGMYDKFFKKEQTSAYDEFQKFISESEKKAPGDKIDVGLIKGHYDKMLEELKILQAEAPTPAIEQKIKSLESAYKKMFTFKDKEKYMEDVVTYVDDPTNLSHTPGKALQKKVVTPTEMEREVEREVKEASPQMLWQLQQELQGFSNKVNPYVSVAQRELDEVSAPLAFDIQQGLKDEAAFTNAQQLGSRPGASELANKASKGYDIINKELEKATEGMSQAQKNIYKKYVNYQRDLGAGFNTPQKTFNTLANPEANSRKMLMSTLKKVADEGGPDLMPNSKLIIADKYYGNPMLNPLSGGGTTSTSRTIPLAMVGSGLGSYAGYKLAGVPGSMLGAGLGAGAGAKVGSPAAMKSLIGFTRKLDSGLKKVPNTLKYGTMNSAWDMMEPTTEQENK